MNPWFGKSTKGDKGSGKDISAKSDLNRKHPICRMEHPSRRAPCIPVQLQQIDFLAEHIYVRIRKGQSLRLEREHSILLCDVPVNTKGG
jgi:hypothetical protein